MNLKTASFTTELGNRFATGNAHAGIEIFNNIQVNSYTDSLPSKGSVSAFIKGTTMEGRFTTTDSNLDDFINQYEKTQGLSQTMDFSDFTSMSGDITSFTKFMSYKSFFAF
jgi:hypothetical protein